MYFCKKISMDIVQFYKDKVTEWNAENRCGFCYEFGAPLFNSNMNVQQTENCCINVFLVAGQPFVRSVFSETINKLGFRYLQSCIYKFDLYLVKPVILGQNNYNEIKGYDIEEGHWSELYSKLMNCFGCGQNQCETMDNFAGYKSYSVSLVQNYLDSNYCGIKISIEVEILNQ